MSCFRARKHVRGCIYVPKAVFIQCTHSACKSVCVCDFVKKLVFVKRLVFSGQRVSQGEELSAWLICAAGIRHKQRRPPMSNVTALISFQCSPGITAGVRDRHTSLLHRMSLPGDSTIYKSTGFILMKSIAACNYCVVFCCLLILKMLGSICVMQEFSISYKEIWIVFLLQTHLNLVILSFYNKKYSFVFPLVTGV